MKFNKLFISGFCIALLIFSTIASTVLNVSVVEEENPVSYRVLEEKIVLFNLFDLVQKEALLNLKKEKVEDAYLLKSCPIIYFEIVIPPPEVV